MNNYKKLFLFLILVVFFNNLLLAQNKYELENKWPETDAVISSYTTTIEYYINDISNSIEAKRIDDNKIIALKNKVIERLYFQDDHSKVDDYSLKKDGVRKRKMVIIDGDQRKDNIFVTGLKFKHYKHMPDYQTKYYLFTAQTTHSDIRYFTTCYLNDVLYPVTNRKLIIKIPSWLQMEVKGYNFDNFGVTRKDTIINNQTIITFSASDLVNFRNKDKDFIHPSHSYPHIILLPKKYTGNQTLTYQPIENIHGLYEWYKELADDLSFDKTKLKPLVNDITKNATNGVDSVKQIYYWVQDNIRYIAFEKGLAGFRPEKAYNVFNNKYGDCKGMSNLLRCLLLTAGYKAHLAWLGTNTLPYDYSTPSICVDNHMICYLNFNNKDYYLDATNKMLPLGMNGIYNQGKQVLIENGDSFVLKNIPLNNINNRLIKSTLNLKLVNKNLEGDVLIEFMGESNFILQNHLSNIKTNEIEDFVRNVISDKKYENIDSIKVLNIGNRDKNVLISYNTKFNSEVTAFDNELFINIPHSSTPEKSDTTKLFHKYIGPRSHYKTIINISIPSEYKITHIPNQTQINCDKFSFQSTCSSKDSIFTCTRNFISDTQIIYKNQFAEYYDFSTKCENALSQTIGLIRK